MSNYWEPVEAQWRSQNLDELSPLLDVIADTHQLVADIAQHPEIVKATPSTSLNIERLLLRRLGEELRAVELLACNGHGFQSVSGAANLFEQSHFLTYVSNDDAKAEEFLNWTDLHRSMDSVKKVVETSGSKRGWNADRTEEEYQKYRFLCGFKHNNPRFQTLLQLPCDPDLYLAKLALADSIWFMLTTVGLLAVNRLTSESLSDVISRCNPLLDRAQELLPTLPPDTI
ncbi:hypothetical protein LOC68_05545 [Blastopirellula sp. JC732]|uniref:Uncharacterized protein n=1 Tax=Blastopirellula sediminis TaxID=2894196 RepID=A0A9X1SFK9_9BACT|nr:hypothetical protein [Blastopirellula sediminis]MCC9609371.1 hypothetical protein [Blastopirellula sediminis]MCC9627852.1 hypothetical protein [Blastopirellula sediminis]